VRAEQIGVVLNRSRAAKTNTYYYARATKTDRRLRRDKRPKVRA
jgi:hypothetical protein